MNPFEFTDETMNVEDTVSLTCTVSKGDFPLDISWEFNSKVLKNGNGIVVNQNSKRISMLSIDAVQAAHRGNYTCIAKNKAGNAMHTAQLNVNGRSFKVIMIITFIMSYIFRLTLLIPCIFSFVIFLLFGLVSPQIMPFDFGSDPANALDMVLVTCAVSKGDLPLKIKWLKDDSEILSGQSGIVITTTKRTSQLSIESLSHDNQGMYTCVVKNRAGKANHTTKLVVNGNLDI